MPTSLAKYLISPHLFSLAEFDANLSCIRMMLPLRKRERLANNAARPYLHGGSEEGLFQIGDFLTER